MQSTNDNESEIVRSFHSNGADKLIALFDNHTKIVVPNSSHYVHCDNFNFVNDEIIKFLHQYNIIK